MIDKLQNDIDELKAINKKLLERIEKLEAENAELRSRLGLNSENSHKPPSSDGLQKKPAFPRNKNNKNGGQKGHKGNTLRKVDEPDIITWHNPKNCSCCGRNFHDNEIESFKSRQVFELPPQKLIVTEHRVGFIHCCGTEHKGEFPENVTNTTQYGNSVNALSVLLSVQYRLPLEQISQLFEDLYGYPINSSTIIDNLEESYQLLEPIEQQIKEKLLTEYVMHSDETGARVAGKLHWLHTACSENYTHLFFHPSRGKEALYSEQSILKDFKNNLVHDCWSSYFLFNNCTHIICNAHILRELTNLIEKGSNWANLVHQLLMECYNNDEDKPPDNLYQRYEAILVMADKEEPLPVYHKRGRPKQSVGRRLFNRLQKYKQGVLAFAFDKAIPFTNNQAERDIRCVKVKLKVSGGFRTTDGANCYARIQSFISTLRKQNLDVFEYLQFLISNVSFSFS